MSFRRECMAIYGTEGMNGEQLYDEIHRGGRFVVYQYAVSLLVITFRRGSDIYFIKAGKSAVAQGLPYTFLSLLLGWWGFPWGIIYHRVYCIQLCWRKGCYPGSVKCNLQRNSSRKVPRRARNLILHI